MYIYLGKRILEVEEQLSKVEEKKKRDLENLKKQNERIAVMQVGSLMYTYIHMYVYICSNVHTDA
jgi:hypothetical protein